jgi:hypothetical protein
MTAALLRHDFLVLALLFAVPPAVVALLRPDLSRRLGLGALASLPFALTERYFLGEYWSPTFLFDLGDLLGFGIEDFFFVAAFGAFAVTAYPVFARARVEGRGDRRGAGRLLATLAGLIGAALALHLLGAPMFVATVAVEALAVVLVVVARGDLAVPALVGGLVTAAVYALVCLAFGALLPGVFGRVWHTEGLIDRAVAGIPLEELLYGGLSGALATVALPATLGERYVRR